MKAKPYIITLFLICGSSFWAQNGIGTSYAMRVFPFQHWNNNQSPYLQTTYDDWGTVKVSNADEHTLTIYFQKAGKNKKRIFRFGITGYQGHIDFSREHRYYHGDVGVNGASGTGVVDTKSGTYTYGFMGFSGSVLKSHKLLSDWSLITGVSGSVHFLAAQRLSNQMHTVTTMNNGYWYENNIMHSYSETTTSSTNEIEEPEQPAFNVRIEFPIHMNYSFDNNSIFLGSTLGISTQSRILVKDIGINFFYTLTIGYIRLI